MPYSAMDVCRHIIKYSNEKDYGVSNLKLQHLLYLIQAYFVSNLDRACFSEAIEAWSAGPVVPRAYREYAKHGNGDIPTPKWISKEDKENIWDLKEIKYEDNIISEEDKKIIDEIVDMFSEYTISDMAALTLNQAPWIEARGLTGRTGEIKTEKLKEYFG